MHGESMGVEHQAGVGPLAGVVAVEGVARNGMAQAVEVHANLVPPACAGAGLDERVGPETLPNVELGEAGLARRCIDGHAAGAKLPQRLVDHAPVLADDTVRQGQVDLANGAALELAVQIAMGLGGPGEDDHAAGLPVEPVDDIEPLAPLGRENIEELVARPPSVGDGRHAFRLVHDDDIVVFVEYLTHCALRPSPVSVATVSFPAIGPFEACTEATPRTRPPFYRRSGLRRSAHPRVAKRVRPPPSDLFGLRHPL